MGQKGSVLPIILFVLILAVLGGFLWFKSQNTSGQKPKTQTIFQIPKTTPAVKTYQDNQLNFQFEYPPTGFEVAGDNEENYFKITQTDHRKNFTGYVGYKPPVFVKGLMLIEPGENIKPDYGTVPFSLWVFDNPDKLSIDSWFDKYWYYPFVWGIFDYASKNPLKPVSEATISGQLAKSAVVSYQPGKPEFIYIANGDKMFMLRVLGEGKDQVVGYILQTFKFTN